MYIASSKQMMKYDRYLIDSGYTIEKLVDIASRALFKHCYKFEKNLIFCGPGNNGADGIALACRLKKIGKDVKVYQVLDATNDVFSYYLEKYEKLGGVVYKVVDLQKVIDDIKVYDNIIDGIFGFHCRMPITGEIKQLIKVINDYSKFTTAIDICSGLDSDLFCEHDDIIMANQTITFVAIKQSLLHERAIVYTGKIIVEPLVEHFLKESGMLMHVVDKTSLMGQIKPRTYDGHKGVYGKVLQITGSKSYRGAAMLSAKAALYSGSGGVCVYSNNDVLSNLVGYIPECIMLERKQPYDESVYLKYQAILLGSGLGLTAQSIDIVKHCIENSRVPIVIDGDALTILSHSMDLLKTAKVPIILTPHFKEFQRLCEDINKKNQYDKAIEFCLEHNVMMVLKGPSTLVTNGDVTYRIMSGNKAMAMPGMGDVLAGMISSFIGQGYMILDAIKIATFIHGYCGDLVSHDNYTVMPSQLIEYIPKVMKELL